MIMKVVIKHSEKLHFKAFARTFKEIDLDEPESFHGTNLGPSPVEHFLIGVGGCLGSSFMYCLIKNKIEIEDLEIIVDGKLTHKVPKMRLRLVNIDVVINITPKKIVQDEEIDSCIKEFNEFCVISEPLMNGIPININCNKKSNFT